MKIIALGDPHGSQKIYQVELSKADRVRIPGDIGKADKQRKYYREYYLTGKVILSREEVIQAYKESIDSAKNILLYVSSNSPQTLVVTGNADEFKKGAKRHGWSLPTLGEICRDFPNVKVIDYQYVNHGGLRIAGLPNHFDFSRISRHPLPRMDWLMEEAEREKRRAVDFLDTIRGKPVDILLSHDPPFCGEYKGKNPGLKVDMIDSRMSLGNHHDRHAGSLIIREYLLSSESWPKTLVCGHIHEGKGIYEVSGVEIINCGSEGEFVEFELPC